MSKDPTLHEDLGMWVCLYKDVNGYYPEEKMIALFRDLVPENRNVVITDLANILIAMEPKYPYEGMYFERSE